MRKLISFLFLSFVLILSSCMSNENANGNSESKNNTTDEKITSHPEKVTIFLYGDFSRPTAKMLRKELLKYFKEVKIAQAPLTLPKEYYNKEANRYRATGLLEDLKPRRNNDVVIGLTNQIIYNPNELSDTYGIMGISKLGSNVCVISSKIPRNGRVQEGENFVKLALHELGHSYGLPHCPDQKCYMVDAEHKMKLPNTKYFCPSCLAKLQKQGWKL